MAAAVERPPGQEGVHVIPFRPQLVDRELHRARKRRRVLSSLAGSVLLVVETRLPVALSAGDVEPVDDHYAPLPRRRSGGGWSERRRPVVPLCVELPRHVRVDSLLLPRRFLVTLQFSCAPIHVLRLLAPRRFLVRAPRLLALRLASRASIASVAAASSFWRRCAAVSSSTSWRASCTEASSSSPPPPSAAPAATRPRARPPPPAAARPTAATRPPPPAAAPPSDTGSSATGTCGIERHTGSSSGSGSCGAERHAGSSACCADEPAAAPAAAALSASARRRSSSSPLPLIGGGGAASSGRRQGAAELGVGIRWRRCAAGLGERQRERELHLVHLCCAAPVAPAKARARRGYAVLLSRTGRPCWRGSASTQLNPTSRRDSTTYLTDLCLSPRRSSRPCPSSSPCGTAPRAAWAHGGRGGAASP